MISRTKFILVTLGEELLLGLTKNSHLSYIGAQLGKGGATLHANVTISDYVSDIEEYFSQFWTNADVLITTGGLGPTVDDRTKETVAKVLGEPLVFDEKIMGAIEARFAARGLELTENNRKQAFRFKSSETLANPNGTAPGLWLEKNDKILIMLPGPPLELIPMFENHVLPRLRALGFINSKENYLQVRTCGIGESSLETLLQPVLSKHEGVEVAYCAHPGSVDFRVSFPNVDHAHDSLVALAYECKESLGDNYLCCGDDSLVQVVSNIMRRRDLSLATAESCTGGLISNEITNLPGASDFFCGGLTTYSNETKEELLGVPVELIQQHTAVSAETAFAMALGVAEKLESDYSLSTTGYIGPGGGSPETPVGTVFVGLHSPRGTWTKRFFFQGTRTAIKQRVAHAALDWLRRDLLATSAESDQSHEQLRAESVKIIRSLR